MDRNNAPEVGRLHDLWTTHQATDWPSSVQRGGDELWDEAGVEPVMLDGDVAGVVSSLLSSRRPPDAGQQAVLLACLADLDRVLPVLSSDARGYFGRLREISDLALRTAGRRS